MGCSSSKKNLPEDPVLITDSPDKPGAKPVEPAEVVLEPEPDPEPPSAPSPCSTYRPDADAAPCLDCPAGWLKLTAREGKKEGCCYFFSSTRGASQWERPEGPDKAAAEPTCVGCGTLKIAHSACEEWVPQPGTEPPTCNCGFTKDAHKPCMAYRVNMAAANFGDCKCGFPKDMHEAAAFASGAKAKKADRTSKELRDEMTQVQYANCAKYTVNLQSSNFGECICGRPKAEHSPEALAKNATAGQTAGTTRRDSGEVRSKFAQKEKVTCPKYVPDMTAGEFGVCTCGAKRADHTDAALAADTGAKAAKQQQAEQVRAGFVQRAVADCPKFELNMDPAAGYGMCLCGRPRADHSPEALAADTGPKGPIKKTESAVRREMDAKQQEIGTTIESQGARTGVAFGLGNTVRTAAEEEAAVQAAINARAGGADKAAALNEFNEMMKDAKAEDAKAGA